MALSHAAPNAPGRCRRAFRAFPSTPARIEPGEAFFAIQGDNRDGHDFVEAALKAGAGLAVVAPSEARPRCRRMRRCWSWTTCSTALSDLARASRARSNGEDHRRHRLGRQDHHQGSAAPRARPAGRDPRLGRLLQQSLGRAAVARAAARERGVRRVRDRHEPRGRDHAAGRDWCARTSRSITTIAPVHLEFFGTLEAIADAKAEIFSGVMPSGAAIINRDIAQHRAPRGRRRRRRGREHRAVRRERGRGRAAARRSRCSPTPRPRRRAFWATTSPTSSARRAACGGELAGGARRRARAGADLALAGWRSPISSRRPDAATRIDARRSGRHALLIDESYNANPASMRAALALLGQADAGARAAHRGARRHAGTWAGRRGAAWRAQPRPRSPMASTWSTAPAR